MKRWLFATPLRGGIFMFVFGLIATIVTIGVGIANDWAPDAEIGTRGVHGWFFFPAGLVLGIGSIILGAGGLTMLVRERFRPSESSSPLSLPNDDEIANS